LIIAAFVSDVCPTSDADRAALTDRLVDGTTATLVLSLIADARLLRSGVARQVTFDDRDDRQLALHLASAVHAREAHALALALAPLSERQAALLEARMTRVIDELTRPDLAGGSSGDLAASRRLAAERLVHHQPQVVNRLRSGDDDWLLSFAPEELARQAQLVEPVPAKTTVRVAVTPDDTPERWRIDIAAFDRPGLLARITTALFETGLEVIEANVSSWPDGAALDSFVVQATHRPNARAFAEHLERLLSQSEPRWTIGGLSADIDNETLPWHTLVVVTGPNRAGVLAAMCSAFSTSGITVHTARIVSHGEHVANRFAVTDRLGRKLDDRAVVHLRAALAGTRPARRSIVSSLRGQRSLSGAVRSLS
jgi:predicted amino acid-binding ACT domain protein